MGKSLDIVFVDSGNNVLYNIKELGSVIRNIKGRK